jgi:hypothetical protein
VSSRRGLRPTSCPVTILSGGCNGVNWLLVSTLGLGSLPAQDGRRRPRPRMIKGSTRGTVCSRIGGNSPRTVGLAIRGRGPRVSGWKVSGLNAGGGWICAEAGGWGGRRSSVIMSSSDVRGLTGVGAMSVCGSCLDSSHLSLRRLIVLEISDPESNSDSTGVGALGCLCASAKLFMRSTSCCSLSTSSVLSWGRRWRSSSKILLVQKWPSRKSSAAP